MPRPPAPSLEAVQSIAFSPRVDCSPRATSATHPEERRHTGTSRSGAPAPARPSRRLSPLSTPGDDVYSPPTVAGLAVALAWPGTDPQRHDRKAVRTLHPVHRPRRHPQPRVRSQRDARDRDRAGIVQLWNTCSGHAIHHPVLVAAGPVASIAFDRSGRRFATADGPEGGLKLWFTYTLQQDGATLDPEQGTGRATASSPRTDNSCSRSTTTARDSYGPSRPSPWRTTRARSPTATLPARNGHASSPATATAKSARETPPSAHYQHQLNATCDSPSLASRTREAPSWRSLEPARMPRLRREAPASAFSRMSPYPRLHPLPADARYDGRRRRTSGTHRRRALGRGHALAGVAIDVRPGYADHTTLGGRRVATIGCRFARGCASSGRPRLYCWCGRPATAHLDAGWLPLHLRSRACRGHRERRRGRRRWSFGAPRSSSPGVPRRPESGSIAAVRRAPSVLPHPCISHRRCARCRDGRRRHPTLGECRARGSQPRKFRKRVSSRNRRETRVARISSMSRRPRRRDAPGRLPRRACRAFWD